MKINHKKLYVSLVPTALLAMSVMPIALAADAIVAKTAVVSLCGKLFEIDANAAGMSAEERARIVQKNLDNALINAKNRTPAAVKVEISNRNPIVTLDGFHIVTADGNSAARHQTTQMALAQKWADSIAFCLADASAINNYLSMLTGKFPVKQETAVVTTKDRVAVATTDMLFPIALATPLSASLCKLGDNVEAVVTQDVPLAPDYDTYIPKGTIARGAIADAHDFTFTEFPKNGLTVSFYELRTPDGKSIPIDGHVFGGLNYWRQISSQPVKAECCGNVAKISTDAGLTFKVRPAKGVIVGAWKGMPLDRSMDRASRFMFRSGSGLDVAQGETMMLQLNATSAIAVAGSSM